MLAREKGILEGGIRIDQVSGGLEIGNRQCVCHVWTFRNELCLNLVYNEAFYEKGNHGCFCWDRQGFTTSGIVRLSETNPSNKIAITALMLH